jgi:hypothetical protein
VVAGQTVVFADFIANQLSLLSDKLRWMVSKRAQFPKKIHAVCTQSRLI